jgi:signal transduction histidine kinase/streptogramin lyase
VSVVEDHQGRLLVATEHQVFEFIAPPGSQGRGRWRPFPVALKPDQRVGSKLSGELIVSFIGTEGLPNQPVQRVIEDRRGRIYASIVNGGLVEIVEGRAAPVPGSQASRFVNRLPLQDSRGDWWIPTAEGLFRFDGPELQLRRGGRISSVDGIPGGKDAGCWLFAKDPVGKLWMACGGGIYRLDRAQNGRAVFERIPIPPLSGAPIATSDSGGGLWVGGHDSLARLMKGKTTVFQPAEGLPEMNPRSLFRDSRGWLWIGLRYKGVSVTKDPSAENLKFVNYSTEQGLASDTVLSITEDDAGRIYLSTGKGLDQLDPVTGRIRHFNSKDGLAGDNVGHTIKDRNGNIWVATSQGLSKLDPRAERKVDRPPPIYLSRAQVAGEDLPIAETGALSIPELELPATRNNLLIEYVALSFRGENRLRYQYKLEGVDGDWGAQTESRSVNYARLAPGSYRFLARAINQEGMMSAEPVVFRFRILPPLWQKWWFLALVATLIGLAVYALFRYRVARLVELERVRTRIATDLHDDIGAGLSRVAILSEVVKRQVGASSVSGEQSIPLLTEIADSARGLIESMREIIWAIDPRRDALSDVASQVRQFASDVLEAKAINWDFQVAPELEKIKLDTERRRHLFLIFKEALHNIERHAGCKNVRLSLTVAHNQLWGEIRDDGRGFTAQGSDPAFSTNGHGLENMRRRAAQVGGKVNIESCPGQGTCIKLMIPLKGSSINMLL